MRGEQVMPTVSELRDYIKILKQKANEGDMQAMHALLDLNKHKVQLVKPEPELTREEELAQQLNLR